MENIDFQLQAGKSQHAREQSLAIVLTHDGYSFCTAAGHPLVLSRLYTGNWPVGYERLAPAEIMAWLQQTHPELKATYAKVNLAVDTRKSTILPAAVYRDGTGTDYFELVFGRVENEQLHRDSLSALQVELISAMPIGMAVAAAQHFEQLRLFAADAVMFQRLNRTWSEGEQQGMLLRLAHDNLSVWVYKSNQLLSYNQYYVADPADVVYYANLLAEQHQPQLLLCGNSWLYAESLAGLQQYFTEVNELTTEAQSIAFDPQWSNLPAGQLQLLLATLCAS